jgi:phosphotransferase family enzyme
MISMQDKAHIFIGVVNDKRVVGKRPKQPFSGRWISFDALARHAAFRREIAVYRAVASGSFQHLRVPQLVATDEESFFCTEEIVSALESPGPSAALKHRVALALAEFQTALRLSEGVFAKRMLGWKRAPVYGIVRRSLGIVLRTIGARTAGRCIACAFKERRRQSRLAREYAIHGDFSQTNTLVGDDGTLYVIDFTDTFFDRRWPLVDIVRYATKCNDRDVLVDVEPIRSYLQVISDFDGGNLISRMNLSAQVRIALLRQALWTLAARGSISLRKRWEVFLQDVVLDDKAYCAWYRETFAELIARSGSESQGHANSQMLALAGK